MNVGKFARCVSPELRAGCVNCAFRFLTRTLSTIGESCWQKSPNVDSSSCEKTGGLPATPRPSLLMHCTTPIGLPPSIIWPPDDCIERIGITSIDRVL